MLQSQMAQKPMLSPPVDPRHPIEKPHHVYSTKQYVLAWQVPLVIS